MLAGFEIAKSHVILLVNAMTDRHYRIVTFPKSRLSTLDVGRYGAGRHSMFGLLEVDVTNARQRLRSLRQQGHDVSFTAWTIKCIGDCVARNPMAHAIRLHRRQLVLFEDVDIAIPVEKDMGGTAAPLPLLIKSTNQKSVLEVDREIKEAVRHDVSNEHDYILGEHSFASTALKLYYTLPQFVRLWTWRLIFGNPFRAKKHSGTVLVTTVNAIGRVSAWLLPTRSMHGLSFALGTITKKPWVHENKVQVREILNLTVSLDHDVIDGVPARRFLQDLIRDLEKGEVRLMNPIER
jgi:hypothetical protein